MTLFSSAMTTALGIISTARGETLQYATSAGGSFTSLSGFTIHQERVPEPIFDDNGRVVSQIRRAVCKGPASPLLAIGYQIKDVNQTPDMTWAVEGVMVADQQIATLYRQERVGVAGPDRGASA